MFGCAKSFIDLITAVAIVVHDFFAPPFSYAEDVPDLFDQKDWHPP